MLKIKYIRDFERGDPMLVISGDNDDYLQASNFLADKKSCHFDDPGLGTYYQTPFITKDALYLTHEECIELSAIFKRFSKAYMSCHNYFETQAIARILGKDAEVHISYQEYPDRIFDEWN